MRYTPLGHKITLDFYLNTKTRVLEVNKKTYRTILGICQSNTNRNHYVKIKYNHSRSKFSHLCKICATSEMLDCPCSCTIEVMRAAMERNLLPKLGINQMHNGLCHPAHLMTSVTDALQGTSLVIIPSSSTILDHILPFIPSNA